MIPFKFKSSALFCLHASLLFGMLFSNGSVLGQTTVNVVNGTLASNGCYSEPSPFPKYYKYNRQQFILRAANELSPFSANNVTITKIAFKVSNVCALSGTIDGYTIKMKNTTTSAYPTSSTSTYETGLTTVYSGSPTITSTGIITLTLSNAFSYEAGKNIIVDICTSNTQENDNATCYYKTSGFNSCIYSRHSSTAQCAITTTTFSVVQQLPYLDFTYTAAACSALTSGGTISGNQSICSGGDPAVFASTVLPSGGSGGTITYQWQSATTNTEASFSDISGATSATYDPPTGLTSTTYYRRKAKRCTGGMEVTSGIVTVTVVPDPNAPSATKSPNTATACVGSTLTLSSPAYGSIPGMSCGFEYATTTNGTTWTPYSDAVPSLVAVAGTNGIRIRVKGGCISGCEASSFTEYTWTVSAVPTITASLGASRCGTGALSISATASVGTIEWFSASAGGSSIGSSNSGTNWTTPSISSTTNYYAEAVNGSCRSVARTMVTAIVNTTPVITQQPAVVSICSTGSGSYTVATSTSGATFQWQYSDDNVTWHNTDGAPGITGHTSTTLNLSNPNVTWNGFLIHCIVSAGGCQTNSNSVALAITSPPTAPVVGTITQPTCSVATGSVALSGLPSSGSWTVTASPGGSTITVNNSSTGSFTGLAANTYTFTVSNGVCTSSSSGTAVISAQPTVPSQPSAITGASPICSGVNQTFSVTNESGVTYAWTYSGTGTISGSGNSITLNATTGGTLTVTPSNGCGNGTARTLTISMTPILSAGSHNSDPLSGCIGTNVSLLSLSGVSGGKSPYSYQWQINGVNAPASANSANATSSTYDPDAFTSSGIYSIRCKVTDACGVIAYTAPKVVNVVADPTIPSATQSPTSSPVCSGTTLTLTNPQYGVEQGMSCEFEYQTSFDGGTTWSSVSTVIPVLSAGGSEVRIRMRVSSNCLTGCNASPWQTYTWSVIQPSIAPTNILGTTTLCNGNSTTLTLSGGTAGTGATAQWFAGSCGSTVIGTGSSISVSPSSNTTYFVRYSGTCNTTTCTSIAVNVANITSTSSLTSGDLIWKGSSSADYTDAANWLSFNGSQLVPSSSQPSTSTNVIIPAITPACIVFQPSLDLKIGYARNFTIESGGVINMGNGRLNVNGDFRNYGTFNEGTSTVIMKGSSDRDTIYGVGASHTFYNLTIDKVGGIEAVLGSHIDVTNELRVVSKNLRLNSLNINLGTAGTLLDEGPGHRVYCDCATGYIQRIASIPAGVTVDPGNLGLTITTTSGKPMGLTTIKRRHMRAGSQTGVNELKPGKPGVYRIFDVSPEFNGGTTYPLASGGLDVDLEYQYYYDEVGSDIEPLEDQFVVWRSGDAGSTWQSFGGTTNTETKTITLTDWPQFSWLTGGPPPSALPIELVSFEANCKGTNQVSITWSTATEHNTSHFVLDKSRDGVTWDLVGQVQAAGNSSQLTNYEMIDSEQLSGVTYYRLKQVDMNGEVETFYPVSASCKGGVQGNVLTTNPNPSTDGFYVNLFTETMEGNGQLTILDASGRRVYEKAISIKNGNTIFHIGDFDVEPGMYYIQVSNGTSSEIVKHILR